MLEGEWTKVSALRSIMIAFSLYSRIPMPTFDWDDKDYRHAIAFLPLVGVVIGGIIAGAVNGTEYFFGGSDEASFLKLPTGFFVMLLAVLPIILTGGFHVDGYMDVSDAMNSFAQKEKRLEIMKDPHIGAFAVIGLLKVGLLWLAGLYVITDAWLSDGEKSWIYLYCLGFVTVRSLCGMTSLFLPKAKKDGMLSKEVKGTGKFEMTVFVKELGIAVILGLFVNPWAVCACLIGCVAFIFFYRHFCISRFGGVTGDTAGYFVVSGELVFLWIIVICCLISRFL